MVFGNSMYGMDVMRSYAYCGNIVDVVRVTCVLIVVVVHMFAIHAVHAVCDGIKRIKLADTTHDSILGPYDLHVARLERVNMLS